MYFRREETLRIYMDNGSTSLPKAPGVGKAMADYIEKLGVNVGRGGYSEAYGAEEIVLNTRERLCELFNFKKAENVVFTSGVTASLNQLLKGLLKAGDHVITTSMEHNAVMRPLTQMKRIGVTFDAVPCKADGRLDPRRIEEFIRPNTKAVVMLHASNVSGTIMPAEQVGEICRRRGVYFILDTAQTGGAIPVDMEGMNISAIAFAGHKGLMGPQGIGGFIVTDEFAERMEPLISGGTGSLSHLDTIPDLMPDKFEAGTQNLPGIFGLHCALKYIGELGIKNICRREHELTEHLIEGFGGIKNIRIAGLTSADGRTGVVSLDFLHMDNADAAFELEQRFGIMTRCGLHCAPHAHKTLGTYPQGTVRFSPGYLTTDEEIAQVIEAVQATAER